MQKNASTVPNACPEVMLLLVCDVACSPLEAMWSESQKSGRAKVLADMQRHLLSRNLQLEVWTICLAHSLDYHP